MTTSMKRQTVTLPTSWGADLDKLKKEQFYNTSQSEMLRHLIQLGLNEVKRQEQQKIS